MSPLFLVIKTEYVVVAEEHPLPIYNSLHPTFHMHMQYTLRDHEPDSPPPRPHPFNHHVGFTALAEYEVAKFNCQSTIDDVMESRR